MKRLFTTIIVLAGFLCSLAQVATVSSPKGFDLKEGRSGKFSLWRDFCKENDILNHLDLGFTLGTGGLGFELTSPVTRWARVRLGYSWTPRSDYKMFFDLSNYGGDVDFKDIQEAAEDYLGLKIKKTVRMNGETVAHHLRFLVDLYPFQDKKQWRFTTGFYWGPKKIATACNDIDEMQLTMGVMLYNKIYDFVMKTDFIETPIYGDFFLDPQIGDMLKDKFSEFGYLGVGIGKYRNDGRPCILEPDDKGKMTANMYANNFCPYVGVGYDTQFGPEKRWKLGVDAGCLIWGGSPSIITQALKVDSKGDFIFDAEGNRIKEDVDLVRDVKNIKGRPGTYVSIARCMKVYPILNLTLSYVIF